MKLAQDYLSDTASGEERCAFNSRLLGRSWVNTLRGIPSGPRWGQADRGWMAADKMIRMGLIYSKATINGTEIEFKCMPDGDAFCCVGAGFVNLQESDNYAFGSSRDEAISKFADLCEQ